MGAYDIFHKEKNVLHENTRYWLDIPLFSVLYIPSSFMVKLRGDQQDLASFTHNKGSTVFITTNNSP